MEAWKRVLKPAIKTPIVLLIFAVVIFVMLYVFSIGPVALLIRTTRASPSTINIATKV